MESAKLCANKETSLHVETTVPWRSHTTICVSSSLWVACDRTQTERQRVPFSFNNTCISLSLGGWSGKFGDLNLESASPLKVLLISMRKVHHAALEP
jgi:hypothetical protein